MLRLLAAVLPLVGSSLAATGNHPEWDRWCGKVYEPKYPSFNPGGQLQEPNVLGAKYALLTQLQTRYNLYLESEKEGVFLINPTVSQWYGGPWDSLDDVSKAPDVEYSIWAGNSILLNGTAPVGKLTEAKFDLSQLTPSFDSIELVLQGKSSDGKHGTTGHGEFFYLPEKTTGSVTKIDNLNGGFIFRNSKTNGKFVPILPYGFYSSCDGFLCADNATDEIKAYAALGLTGMIPLTTAKDSPDDYKTFEELDLKFMYDLRSYYQNLTAVKEQVTSAKDFDTIYSYWGADEPDGHQDNFNGTVLSRNLIRTIDPYHPVSVTLNCENYYFQEYTAAADFIMGDPYPIGINSTFSKWGTACNATYGDCGCDNCEGSVFDVPDRLDTYNKYEDWLGFTHKTKVHNPQSFHGEGYWSRDPTPDEEVAMNALAFNHGAKSIMSWVYPPTDLLKQTHGKYSKAVAQGKVADIIVTTKGEAYSQSEGDSTYWMSGDEVLLNVVNGKSSAIGDLDFKFDCKVGIEYRVWGNSTWLENGDGSIKLKGIGPMSTNMIMLTVTK